QTPKPDAKAEKDDTVTIIVSRGPPQVAVPSVVGRDIDSARADLEQLGFIVAQNARQSEKPQNEVLDQSPKAGSTIAKGSTVTLTSSGATGPPTVPDVRGQTAIDAATALAQAGFKTAQKTQPSDTVDA